MEVKLFSETSLLFKCISCSYALKKKLGFYQNKATASLANTQKAGSLSIQPDSVAEKGLSHHTTRLGNEYLISVVLMFFLFIVVGQVSEFVTR